MGGAIDDPAIPKEMWRGGQPAEMTGEYRTDQGMEPEAIADLRLVAGTSLAEKLDAARKSLLDTTTRNRLISTPRRSRSARLLEITNADGPRVYRELVTEQRSAGFAPREVADRDDLWDEVETVQEPAGALRLQTALTVEALRNRLLSLHLDAKTFEEEQGVGILYIAIGFLKWYEAPNSEVERHAPLLLVPVSLDRGTVRTRFRVRWTQEDVAPNLSLLAMLRQEFGVSLPEWDETEDLDPAAYFDDLRVAISDQPRWVVESDDVVIGFFSFAKFLMYRDLDAANWPKHEAIDAHPIVSALFGDGFEPAEHLLPEDADLDQHLPSATMLHVLDADSSQAAVIEEARQGRNLVVQGPPGTGKSQTIANIIAAAVASGRKILFVAEKMAALEVVKRRLDSVGIGDMCLELHSRNTNKRAVVKELDRVWQLGRPAGEGAGDITERLDALRRDLSAHPARLHAVHDPSGLTAYQAIGHLVRLMHKGQTPSDIALADAPSWSLIECNERRRVLVDLVATIDEIGLPCRHPWRGAKVAAVLPTDLQRLAARLALLRPKLAEVDGIRSDLCRKLGFQPTDSLAGARTMVRLGRAVAGVPECDGKAIVSGCWIDRRSEIESLLHAGETYSSLRALLDGVISDGAMGTDVSGIRQPLAARGKSWLRWCRSDWRRADSLFRTLFVVPAPKAAAERVAVVDRLISMQKSLETIIQGAGVGNEAFGNRWRAENSDWDLLKSISAWVAAAQAAGIGTEARYAVSRLDDPASLRDPVTRLDSVLAEAAGDLRVICDSVGLSADDAFGSGSIEDVPISELHARCGLWFDGAEDLPKWVAYRAQSERLCEVGLTEFSARLADGRLEATDARDEFDMAYYEAVLREMAQRKPEIIAFDGQSHARQVDEFKQVDVRRIELARLEIARAHHHALPQRQGIGAIGTLRTEIAKQKKHLAIRQLIKKTGPAIQAIKPVFMMSPLSVAQFLEPGAVTFDLLVIDEASQVRPVDALGAIARCRQIVVVGDERQLPPTAFFSKLTSDEDDDDDDDDSDEGSHRVGRIGSILGLCSVSGVPERMLRWHYRSRHDSLIAVSNREFYDYRLFIVPSPDASRSDMGLRFHHLPQGTFDIGGTRSNRVEAKAVAERVIEHARHGSNLSLGVAAFSAAQRRAIMDELEVLRRQSEETEEFFTSAHPNEPFFVKNLENVQGDERDVIFISVGYGRNQQGRMLMRFPTLGSDGGERRLNVLITRARQRCEVFSSITDEDIDLERARGKGVSALKTFLRYARTGDLEISRPSARDFDSIFEEQVAAALTSHGYIVERQVGQSGFFIDLAIVDPDRPGRYIIGVECDGAGYHSTRFARDRDRLRQEVLEDHGWTIHRIWSTDWFKRPAAQLRETIAAIEMAKRNSKTAMPQRPAESPGEPPEIPRVKPTAPTSEDPLLPIAKPYEEASFPVSTDKDIHEVPLTYLTDVVHRIIRIEGPIHQDEIIIRVRMLWGQARAGHRIQAAVKRALGAAVRLGANREGHFYFLTDGPVIVRDRSNASSPSLRKPEMLPGREIRWALLSIVERSLGVGRSEAITAVSRAVGFRSTSAQLKAIIDEQIAVLLRSGELVEVEGRLTRS
jgi:very-short-patch-repair endonuclease